MNDRWGNFSGCDRIRVRAIAQGFQRIESVVENLIFVNRVFAGGEKLPGSKANGKFGVFDARGQQASIGFEESGDIEFPPVVFQPFGRRFRGN